jgi:hypothetical protein
MKTQSLSRTCNKCGASHPLEEWYFSKNGTNRDRTVQYFRPECKSCEADAAWGRRQAAKLAKSAVKPKLGTPCDLCGRKDQQLLFDHCHDKLSHRGWLCNSCNKGLGLLGDTVESIEKVLVYLKKPCA